MSTMIARFMRLFVGAALGLALVPSLAVAQFIVVQSGSITTGGADCSVATNCVTADDSVLGTAGSAAIDVRGTFTATLIFEASIDGTNYFTWHVLDQADGSDDTGSTAGGQWLGSIVGYRAVRVRASAASAGSVTVTIRAARNVGSIVRSSGGGTTTPSGTFYVGTNTTSTTPEALAATQATVEVFVQNDPQSTTDVLVGNSSTQTVQLGPGDGITIPASNLAVVYIVAVSGTPTVNYLAR